MFVYDGQIKELKFVDSNNKDIATEVTPCNNAQWNPINPKHIMWQAREIPDQQEIIGFQCNTNERFIHTLSFITWTPNPRARNFNKKSGPLKKPTFGEKIKNVFTLYK